MKFYKAILFFIFFISFNALGSNIEREDRLISEIEDSILDGEVIWLKAGDRTFFSIYTEAEESKGTIILLHGRGLHADWSEVISPVRVGLAEGNWNTLSIQLPVLDKSATYNDYVPIFSEALPRIDSAIAYLKKQSKKPIVLLAHSCGAHMATLWFFSKAKFDLAGFITISAGATDYHQPMLGPFPYSRIKAPILDIYGSKDTPGVLRKAALRLLEIQKSNNSKSKQIIIKDADHYYHEKGDELTQVIDKWLTETY